MTMPEMGQAISQGAFNKLNPDAKVLGQMQFTAKDFKK